MSLTLEKLMAAKKIMEANKPEGDYINLSFDPSTTAERLGVTVEELMEHLSARGIRVTKSDA